MAEAVDVYGQVVGGREAPVTRLARGRARRAHAARPSGEVSRTGPFRLAVVSAADPVDRASGRLIELPDAPFLLGALDAPTVLAELVDGPVTVDNDVNWGGAGRARPRPRRRGRRLRLPLPRRGAWLRRPRRRRGPPRARRNRRRDRHMVTIGPGGVAMPRRRSSARSAFAAPGPPRSTSRRCCAPWTRVPRCATRWPARGRRAVGRGGAGRSSGRADRWVMGPASEHARRGGARDRGLTPRCRSRPRPSTTSPRWPRPARRRWQQLRAAIVAAATDRGPADVAGPREAT